MLLSLSCVLSVFFLSLPTITSSTCQGYWLGGNSGVHWYACCDNSDENPNNCDSETWDGGSNQDYCGPSGQNNGGGVSWFGQFDCKDCDLQEKCADKCDKLNRPFLCWAWLICFTGCCKKNANMQNNGTLNDSFCGDGTCDDDETDSSCPTDCCGQVNEMCAGTSCIPDCCYESTCCSNTTTTEEPAGTTTSAQPGTTGAPTTDPPPGTPTGAGPGTTTSESPPPGTPTSGPGTTGNTLPTTSSGLG